MESDGCYMCYRKTNNDITFGSYNFCSPTCLERWKETCLCVCGEHEVSKRYQWLVPKTLITQKFCSEACKMRHADSRCGECGKTGHLERATNGVYYCSQNGYPTCLDIANNLFDCSFCESRKHVDVSRCIVIDSPSGEYIVGCGDCIGNRIPTNYLNDIGDTARWYKVETNNYENVKPFIEQITCNICGQNKFPEQLNRDRLCRRCSG